MEKPKLTYFDAPVSRGEECRIALHVAGVDFDDHRIKRDEWPALKPKTPFGGLPLLEIPGHPVLAQSNAILGLIGRRHGLLPKDDFEAARHEAILLYAEELRSKVATTLRMENDAKKAAREAIAANDVPIWARNVENQVGAGPFFGGSTLSVADIKLFMVVRWFKSGAIDHIEKTVFDAYPKLLRLFDAVENEPRVKSWLDKSR
jgi:prostaglandin-H2 D-isomerase / glutathione transferase